MKNQKKLVVALVFMLLVGGLSGCGMTASSLGSNTAHAEESMPQNQPSVASPPILNAVAEDNSQNVDEQTAFEERFKIYEQFGMTYDAGKDELYYNGKVVRWFEDYYSLEDGSQAGVDFFNENGVVDVYTVRDVNNLVRNEDGSYDPSGKLLELREFSDAEFAARNIDEIKNPPLIEASAGESLSASERQKMVEEYEAFGVTYDFETEQWFFNGEKVRFFQDVLISNGEDLGSGNFQGAIRSEKGDGTVDIYTVRDYNNLTAEGNGTLISIEKYSQQEFDEHTQSYNALQESSGECQVILE